MLTDEQIMRKIVQLQTTLTEGQDGKTDIIKETKKAFYISALLYVLEMRDNLEL